MARGEPIWQTSSTGPTSIPSSSDAVATSARRSPARSRVSTMRRRAAERLPWWAATSSEASTSSPPRRLVLAQALGQLVGHPLGHLARVDEDQRGAVVPGVLGDAVEDVGHLTAAHDGLELGRGQLDGHLEVAGVAAVDDHGGRAVVVHAREQAGHQVERPLRGREADALEMAAALGDQRVESLEAQRQVAAALVAGQRVHLVDDHGAHAAQQRPRRGGGQEEVERLGRRDEEVGRLLLHGGPLGRRRVAGADGDAQPGVGVARAGPPPPGSPTSGTWRFSCTSTASARSGRDVEDLGRRPGRSIRPRRPGRRRRWRPGTR